MGSLGTAVLDLLVNAKGLTGGMTAAEGTVRRSLQNMGQTGRTLTKRVTLPVLAAGAASVKMALDYESSLSNITGLVGISSKQVEAWGDEMLDLAPKVGKGPKELADALFFITSAGLKGKTAMEALTVSAKASTAGLGETKVVADAVTSAMNAYGAENLSAGQATDILTAAVREGKLEASALAPAIGRAIPLASAMGVSFDEVAASLAAMSRTGTDASTGATQLRAILSSMLKPTQQAEDALKKYDLSGQKLRDMLREDGLIATMQHLNEATGGNKKALAEIFPNIRALSGFLDILGSNAEDNITIYEKLADSVGSTDKAFKDAAESGAVKLDQALAAIQAAAIMVGDILLPFVKQAADGIRILATEFRKLPEGVRSALVMFLLITAAIGPMMVLFAGLFTTTGLVIVGLAALASALYYAWNSSETFRNGVMTAFTFLKTFVPEAIEVVRAKATEVFAWIMTVLDPVVTYFRAKGAEIEAAVREHWDEVEATVRAVMGFLVPFVKTALTGLLAIWRAGWNFFKVVVQQVWNVMKAVIDAGLRIIGQTIRLVMAVLRGDWATAWEAMKGLLAAILSGAVSILKAALTAMVKIGGSLAKNAAIAIWNGIKTVTKLLGSLAGLLISGITGAISAAGSAAYSYAVGVGSRIVSGVLSGLGGLASAIKSKAESAIKGALSSLNPFSPVEHGGQIYIGEKIVKGAIRGLQGLKPKLKRELVEALRGAISEAKSYVEANANSLTSILNDTLDKKSAAQLKALDSSPEAKRLAEIEAMTKAESDAKEKARLDSAYAEADTLEKQRAVLEEINAWKLSKEKETLQADLAAKREAISAETELKKGFNERNIRDLTDSLNRGLITQKQYNEGILAVLRNSGVQYEEVGSLLGTSFANSFVDSLAALKYEARRIPILLAQAANLARVTAKGIKDPKKRALVLKNLSQAQALGAVPRIAGGQFGGLGAGQGSFGLTVQINGNVIGAGDTQQLARELARLVQPELNRIVSI